MKIEGEIESISHREKLIARFSKTPESGARVFDNKSKLIGKVGWIFGPVDDPYVEVKLKDDPKKRLTMMNGKIYAEEI
ncbi:MAG: Gar1/Naf1 family protein [Candidatus Natronoplasma sp.]